MTGEVRLERLCCASKAWPALQTLNPTHCLEEAAALLCDMKGRKWSSGTLCPSVLL